MGQQISFDVTKDDARIIGQVVKRAVKVLAQQGVTADVLSMHMDITACHASGCKLKLAELLAADDFNFGHDVFGISRHINRETGQLEDCFVPRFADTVSA